MGRTRIGIYGGTFSPMHNGHLRVAMKAVELGVVDQVWLMVTPLNPWRVEEHLLDNEARFGMVRRAVGKYPYLKACDFEFSLPVPQYSSRTLRALKEQYADYDFSLIVGSDNWVRFKEWHDCDYIIENFPVITFPRDGYPIVDIGYPVKVMDVECFDISSTRLRSMVRNGEDITGYVPESVAQDIRNNGYYLQI